MRWGLFAILAGTTAVSATALWLLVPETKGLALEEVGAAWDTHWLWGRCWRRDAAEPGEGAGSGDEEAAGAAAGRLPVARTAAAAAAAAAEAGAAARKQRGTAAA